MSKSTLPFLLINLGILFFFGSCGTNNVTKGFEKTRVEKEVYPVPFFSNPDTDYVYKANISVYGHEECSLEDHVNKGKCIRSLDGEYDDEDENNNYYV